MTPCDMTQENMERAERAAIAVRAYAAIPGVDSEVAIIDLLCDLRHLCVAEGVSHAELDAMAARNFEAEAKGE